MREALYAKKNLQKLEVTWVSRFNVELFNLAGYQEGFEKTWKQYYLL